MFKLVQKVDENMKREDRGRRSDGLLVHDSEAVHVQGRGCHPRGQAKGSECWTHIEQSPLKLQEGPENSFSVLPLHPVSSSSSRSRRPDLLDKVRDKQKLSLQPRRKTSGKVWTRQEVTGERGGILVEKNVGAHRSALESLQSKVMKRFQPNMVMVVFHA